MAPDQNNNENKHRATMRNERRIFGPPGTGKTTRLAAWIRQVAQHTGSAGVLVASFTRTAAAEIVGRDLPLRREQIGTLHAHCYHLLGSPPVADGKLIAQFNAASPAYRLSAETGANVDESPTDQHYETPADELAAQYHLLRARMVDRDRWPLPVRAFAARWEAWKQDLGAVDYTDMIDSVLRDYDGPPHGATVGFFDEAQDFSRLQLTLIRKWAASMDYSILAGDDDQLIFGWTGASADAFLTPIADEHKTLLTQSYRVPRQVRDYAQAWIEQVTRREPKRYEARRADPQDDRSPVVDGQVRRLAASYRQAERLVGDAERALAAGHTVMFLTACGFQLTPLIAVLRQRGIPFHNPYRRTRGDWNPLGAKHGISATDRLLAFLRPQVAVWGADARLWTVDDATRWLDLVKADGVLQRGAKTALERLPASQELDFDWFMRWLTDPETAFGPIFDNDLAWLRAHVLPAKAKALAFPLAVAAQRGGAALRATPQVILGTVHSVKGGEADVVYVFPDLSHAGMTAWLTRGEGHDGIIRQFYVAFTRARDTLVLCEPASPVAIQFPRWTAARAA